MGVRQTGQELLTHDDIMDVFVRKAGSIALDSKKSSQSQSPFLEQARVAPGLKVVADIAQLPTDIED